MTSVSRLAAERDEVGLEHARALFHDASVLLTRDDAAELDPRVRPGHLYALVREGFLVRVEAARVRLFRRAP